MKTILLNENSNNTSETPIEQFRKLLCSISSITKQAPNPVLIKSQVNQI